MAEGWARHLKGEVIESYSAGVETHGLNPDAVKVMAEAGVDISGHRSKRVSEVMSVKAARTEEEALNCYRHVRDEIRAYVETLPDSLKEKEQ